VEVAKATRVVYGVSPLRFDCVKAERSPPEGLGLYAVKTWQTIEKGLSNQHVEAKSLV